MTQPLSATVILMEIIAKAVWLYVRFPLGLRMVDDMLSVLRSCLLFSLEYLDSMKLCSSFPGLKGFHFPREIVAYTVWTYYRFALSTTDVENLLAEHGVLVSRESVRLWINRFGRHFADCIRRDRPNYKWYLDEAVITIGRKKYWL